MLISYTGYSGIDGLYPFPNQILWCLEFSCFVFEVPRTLPAAWTCLAEIPDSDLYASTPLVTLCSAAVSQELSFVAS